MAARPLPVTTVELAPVSMNVNNQFLDFSTARVQNITMDQLRQTVKEESSNYDEFGKRIPISGMFHFDFFDKVTDMCEELGYKAEYYDMFAAQNKDGRTPGVTLHPGLEKTLGERAVGAHVLRRVFANIRLLDFDTDEYTTNLSVAFHQRGIQAGFGNNVKICHNQCMLSPERYGATYGKRGEDKLSIQGLLDLIRSWLIDARHIVETDRERIARMKAIPVRAEETLRLIGMLTATRVKFDSKSPILRANKKEYPLNQSQISEYTEDLLVRYETNNEVTVWDLYDAATNLYKATTVDMPLIMPMNLRMVDFLAEQYDF